MALNVVLQLIHFRCYLSECDSNCSFNHISTAIFFYTFYIESFYIAQGVKNWMCLHSNAFPQLISWLHGISSIYFFCFQQKLLFCFWLDEWAESSISRCNWSWVIKFPFTYILCFSFQVLCSFMIYQNKYL